MEDPEDLTIAYFPVFFPVFFSPYFFIPLLFSRNFFFSYFFFLFRTFSRTFFPRIFFSSSSSTNVGWGVLYDVRVLLP